MRTIPKENCARLLTSVNAQAASNQSDNAGPVLTSARTTLVYSIQTTGILTAHPPSIGTARVPTQGECHAECYACSFSSFAPGNTGICRFFERWRQTNCR